MNRHVNTPMFLRRLAVRLGLRRDTEAGFTLVELLVGITVLGIIIVPLGMAISLGFRATVSTQQKLASSQDAQAISAYFPADVQSVDPSGVNPTDSVNEKVCPSDPNQNEYALALFVWNQDLGVSGQTVVRYLARGQGTNSELVRRYCDTTSSAPVDTVLASHFGSGLTTPAKDYFTDVGAIDPSRNETPACGSRACTIIIHDGTTQLFKLTANRRVDGTTNNNTVPGAPTNAHTTGGNTRATVYWDRPIDDGGAPIESYYIQNNVTNVVTGPYLTPAGDPTVTGEPGVVGVVITGLTNGQGYTFSIKAHNVLGEGAYSEPSSVVTPAPTVPDPPTIGTATASPTVAGQASATWSLPSGYNNGGTALTGYHLYALNLPNAPLSFNVPGGAATTGTATGLVGNSNYQFQVAAINSNGESSPSTSSNSVLTLPAKPGTPTASYASPGTVAVTFNAPGGGNFADLTNVRAHAVGSSTYTTVSAASACPGGFASPCTIIVTGLTSGQTVTVQAQNATGWGAESDPTNALDLTAPVVTLTTPLANVVLGTATPTFSGAAGTLTGDLPAVTVNIYSGATATGTPVQTRTTTASGTSWTVDASPALADGQYTAQATQTDTFGNVGASATRSFYVDATGPAVTVTAPANNTASTNLTPTFTGTAGTAAGPFPSADSTTVTVKVYSGTTVTGTPVQTRTATRSGANWSVAASPALATGTYTVQATQTDAVGNVGTSDANTFGIDTTAPTVTITTPAANAATNSATPTISGTAGNNGVPNADASTVTVKLYAGTTATGTVLQTLSAPRTGTSWTVDTNTMTAGQYTAIATQTDAAGNTGTSNTVTFVVDLTAPAMTLTAPANNTATANVTPTFSGAAGNAAGPSPSADSTTVTVKIYSGAGTGGTLVQTRNVTRTAATWTLLASPGLAEGTYTAQATQTDAAGNTGTSTANTFIVDTTGPAVTVTTPADNSATKLTAPTFTGTAGTAAAPNADSTTVTVKVYVGATTGGTLSQTRTATRSGASWSVAASPALAAGTYTVQATQLDVLGNIGTSDPNTFVIDTTAPTVTITAPTAASATNDTTPTISGTAGNQGAPNADSATVTVKVYSGATATGTPVQTLSATRSGTAWSITPTTLASGQYTVQATQTDDAGNTGTSTAITFVVDTTAPTVTITAPTANQVYGTGTNQAVTFTGTAGAAAGPSPSADLTTVNVKVYSGSSATGTPVQSLSATRSSTAWSVGTSSNLGFGTYTVQASQADAAGNTGTSTAITFTVVINHVRVATPANGGSPTGAGTADDPLSTVALGLAKAVTLGYVQVDVAQGTYNEGTLGVALVDNVAVAGGWSQDFTTETGANTSTVIQGGQQAVLADGDTGVTISQIMLSGLGASATDRNVYGLRAINTSAVTLTNVKVTAATGFDGTDGTSGATGAAGGDGVDGSNGANNSSNGPSGAAGGSSNVATNGGNGGAGGKYNTNGVAGSTPTGGTSGGALGSRGASSGCSDGSNGGSAAAGATGTTGTAGTSGSSALASATAGTTWTGPVAGNAGTGGNGASGGGGGGGGGSGSGCSSSSRSSGGAGGGGGEAGTGGTGGTGGSYGGGSFGVYAYNSSVTLNSTSSVATGTGGAGGDGGTGSPGGTGGDGGTGGAGGTHGGDGGKGGTGGNGAVGGRGGGGPGGPSVALVHKGTGANTQGSASLTVGSGGSGGAGGNAGGTGVAQTIANL